MSLYLDANADAPAIPEALTAYREAAADFGNPSSAHAVGQAAAARLAAARAAIAAAIEAEPDEIVFTSGGTEADALALRGLVSPGAHVVTSTIEHAAVATELAALEVRGITISRVSVDRSGRIDPDRLLAAVTPRTRLVTVTRACNETGVVQPLKEIVPICRARGVLVHTDAVQAVGKMPVSARRLDVDALSFSGHKLGAPFGVGVLFVRRGVALSPLVAGGGQESGRRAGTENVAGIAALAAALAAAPGAPEWATMTSLRNELERRLVAALPDVEILGASATRLCNTSCIRFPDCEGDGLLMALDLAGVAVSTGSACSSGSVEPSPILLGMGLDKTEARSTLRLSLSRVTTLKDVVEAAVQIVAVVERARRRR